MANYTTSRRQKLEQRLRQVIPTMVEEVYQEVEQQDDPPTLRYSSVIVIAGIASGLTAIPRQNIVTCGPRRPEVATKRSLSLFKRTG